MLTMQRRDIAEAFLARVTPADAHAAYYVLTAHEHGVPVERIAELTGIPLNRVVLIVKEG